MSNIYTVSKLNASVRKLLESKFNRITVAGEISNLLQHTSGHWYFSLKDDNAQIRCAMFRNANSKLSFNPEEGMQVHLRAQVSLYTVRGDYQLIVSDMEEIGDGALQKAYQQLKRKLNKEGLFAQKYKQELPEFPQSIGVITSSTGAALRDIINVLQRRCPLIPIIVYPTLVQGAQAAENIVKMINIANQRQECNVLIVGRGGGSLEDLWTFNEEIVARAIFESELPIVSAVGHEIDISISDLVADQRAATPSVAAELVSPDLTEYSRSLIYLNQRLKQHLRQHLKQKQQNFIHLYKRLRHPQQKLQEQAQQLDYYWQNLAKAMQHYLNSKAQHLSHITHALNTISPLATLDRGYAILQQGKKIIRNIKNVKVGDHLTARLSKGSIKLIVDGTSNKLRTSNNAKP